MNYELRIMNYEGQWGGSGIIGAMATSDDDVDVTYSDPNKFKSDRRLQSLKRRLEQEGKRVEPPAITQDKANLKLSVLKNQLNDGQKDALTKQDRAAQEAVASKGFGTKTREQEIQEAKMGADTKPQPDQLISQGQTAAAAKEEQQREGEVQTNPA